jgi:serine/threonine protein kinase
MDDTERIDESPAAGNPPPQRSPRASSGCLSAAEEPPPQRGPRVSSGWRKAQTAARVYGAVNSFTTLRQVVDITNSELAWSDYSVVKHLGRGAFGEVSAYKHNTSGQTIAVKVLNGPAGRSPQAVADLQAEAKLLSRLSHPYLMRLFGVGTIPDSGHLFFASELLSEGSLQKVVMQAGFQHHLPVPGGHRQSRVLAPLALKCCLLAFERKPLSRV